ncbi:MAG: lipopolysaccharide transport periplasmic protein LptA [bacterium]
MYSIKNILLYAGLVLTSQAAMALSTDRDQPVEVVADSVEIDEAAGTSIYIGEVEINQGSIQLLADKVTVFYQQSKVQRLLAEGKPVKFRQLPDDSKEYVKGRGNRVEYMVQTEELILTDNAVLTQGKDSFSSDRIVYDRHQAKLKAGAAAQGKQRVRVTIQPPKK